jgi:hypothetical protein
LQQFQMESCQPIKRLKDKKKINLQDVASSTLHNIAEKENLQQHQ